MTLRIAYINTRGLNPSKWSALLNLFDDSPLDFLFLAETWYWRRKHVSFDRRFVCMTKLHAPDTSLLGRLSGGIYLLTKPHARGWILELSVTEHHITVTTNLGVTVSAVYLPPSMSEEQMSAVMTDVRLSTVILGDVNVRFDDPDHQEGQPGPPSRLRCMRASLATSDHLRLNPDAAEAFARSCGGSPPKWSIRDRLTVDHCFAKSEIRPKCRLFLVDSGHFGITTDHKYALHLILDHGRSVDLPPPETLHTPVRFRIDRMDRKKGLDDRLRVAFRRLYNSTPYTDVNSTPYTDVNSTPYTDVNSTPYTDVNSALYTNVNCEVDCDAALVSACQEACTSVLGRLSVKTTRQTFPDKDHLPSKAISPALTTRLFKSAVTSSKENSTVLPTPVARLNGISALMENYTILKDRYSGPTDLPRLFSSDPDVLAFDRRDIVEEIMSQDGTKSPGRDGIHIKIMKVLSSEPLFIDHLHRLYNLCLSSGRTPPRWNQTDVHLLIKKADRPKDADNLRPITLICMFRKVFERLLLKRFDLSGWARLHPSQTGFRNHHSTCSTAAAAHHLLASGRAKIAIFVDFKSAFDVVNHRLLRDKLISRACPPYILALISSLNFEGVESTVFVNDTTSPAFPRNRGVLQGSPISPLLFNIFIDDLVHSLNSHSDTPCLFYADDGTIFGRSYDQVRRLLTHLTLWCRDNGISVNVSKCGHITTIPPQPLFIDGREIPVVSEYDYLGFPITASGIDFEGHVNRRVVAAVNRSKFLALRSDTWGPSHRLAVYKQFLAPMFEYGAPLVSAWLRESPARKVLFDAAIIRHRELLGWISDSSGQRCHTIANLCGLQPLALRFDDLSLHHASRLGTLPGTHPLISAMGQHSGQGFLRALQNTSGLSEFRRTSGMDPPSLSLRRYLEHRRGAMIAKQALSRSVLKVIPPSSRLTTGHLFADITLSAPPRGQDLLFRYRTGMFMSGCACKCLDEKGVRFRFRRGHENCHALPHAHRLSKLQRMEKVQMRNRLHLRPTDKFTDVDFLLACGDLTTATKILFVTKRALQAEYVLLQEENEHDQTD